jgi:beta-glucosidase
VSGFPPGFRFGVASSAYQIEGAVAEDGRGRSIWDTFCHEPGRVRNGENADLACDHYHRWAEDVDLIASLGVNAYRFSVGWPRILPSGTGPVNGKGLDFYDRLVERLLERGIEPVLTTYHWDLPQALQDRGGWGEPWIVEAYADFVEVLGRRFGDRVRAWVTVNEPHVFSFFGHARGLHAPGLRDWDLALRVSDHAVAGHRAADARLRNLVREPEIGVALDLNLVVPASDRPEDVEAALRHRAIRQDWFLDPLFGRGYPERALAAHRDAGHLPELEGTPEPGAPLDFVGVNYYTREVVSSDPAAPFGIAVRTDVGSPTTTMGWEVNPGGLRDVLVRVHREYGPPALMVTENGAAFVDPEPTDGTSVPDEQRLRYLDTHLAASAEAIAEGVPLTGFFAWSLLDNFEWERGFDERFGIVHVDYASQARTVKASGDWYRSFVQEQRRQTS